jgi:prolyl-tRNA editing enzyme YbaK/EbsC (Cys-tRNA(Pro) deacylase)
VPSPPGIPITRQTGVVPDRPQLEWWPAGDHLDLVAPGVAAVLKDAGGPAGVEVAEIEESLADTEALCAHYGLPLADSANCVVVAAKRGGVTTYAACVVLATTRADVNNLVRRHLDARKATFARLDDVVAATGMEYGGITPVGLPADWRVLVDADVAAHPAAVVGSGVRRSKLRLPGASLAALPNAEVLPGLGKPV